MSEIWPWLMLAGLGAFHGLNPAMGWLFSVALGLHRGSRRVVWLSLLPIGLGHALSVASVALLFVLAGTLIDGTIVRIAAGITLIAWAIYRWHFRSRHRVRVGLKTGLMGLGLWSFLMATAHGAGLMLWPALMPLCFPSGRAPDSGPLLPAVLGVGVHTLAIVAVTATIAITVYEWIGVEILRRAWINLDAIWMLALATAGLCLLPG
ncbi:MAG: hypothetical protein J0J01_09170 [Reyranella sp.]|nr:hypothetical protein [Reyranella sp.]